MITAAVNASTWSWYFARATGLVALVLLTAIIVLGVLGPLRIASERWPRFAIRTVHRDVSLLALLVIAIHVVAIVLDGYVKVPLSAAMLPWGSSFSPFWTGLGALSFDLMIAIVVTSLARKRLGYKTWRFVHWFAYASWPLAVAHGLATGSDSGAAWALALTITCIAVVAATVVMRLQYGAAARTLEA
jgi:methionine sulfoxide reductase heme-binding subunit